MFSSSTCRLLKQSRRFPSGITRRVLHSQRLLCAASSHVVSSSSSQFSDSSGESSSWWMVALAATAVNIWSSDSLAQNRRTQCAGILGVVGNSGGTSQGFFLQGLTVLKNQGLDGVGIATIDESKKGIVISKHVVVDDEKTDKNTIKAADPVLRFVESHYSTHYPNHNLYTGMAHTRWATQGGKTQESNVHPHLDSTGKIALIHNGALTNAKELRNELIAKGHVFEGQTDSEVIAKLVGHYYAKGGRSVKEATERALKRCDGTWGLCILCSDNPDEMVVACNGSSLYIGLGDDRIYVSSELSIFDRYTKNYIVMNDGEIGVLHADGRTLDLSRRKAKEFFEDEVAALPTPYDHWTLKEIMDQPEAIGRALCFGGRLSWEKVCLGGLDQNSKKLEKIQHLAVGGCGSSFNAAKYGERIMKHLASVTGRITSIDMVEAEYLDLACPKDNSSTGLIAISQSGETSDVKSFVETAMDEGTTTVGVVNVVGSMIARATKMGVYCHAGQENGVVSTKSFAAQVTILALIALWFRELRDQMEGIGRPSIETERLKEALLRLPISLGMALKTRNQCKGIAERLKKKEHCFVLGKGFGEAIAYEGALKIKEMSTLHAEGYSGGALKHGPFALIEDETGHFGATPIIMLILDDQHAHHMRTAAEEVKARGADLIIITDKPRLAEGLDDNPIVIPPNGLMTALGALISLQFIAYELAIARGINPDTPRNLAKYYR